MAKQNVSVSSPCRLCCAMLQWCSGNQFIYHFLPAANTVSRGGAITTKLVKDSTEIVTSAGMG